MKIVTRTGWKARTPKPSGRNTVSWGVRSEFFVHHTEGPIDQTVRSIQDFHMNTHGWGDIGYNFLVRDDGTIYEGRGWLVVGAHCPDHNRVGIGVAFIGQNSPTDAAMRAIRWLYDEACRQAGRPLRKLGHGDRYPTDCPGSKLRDWVHRGMQIDDKDVPPHVDIPKWTRPLSWPPTTKGDDVSAWQRQMRKRGWQIEVDGWYSQNDQDVCVAYQKEKGAKPTGVVDKKTWELAWTAEIT